MSLIATIKAASLQARRDRNAPKAALLSTLLGDIQMVGKNDGNRDSTDGEAIAVIKKMLVNAREMLEVVKVQLAGDTIAAMVRVGNEIEWLNSFLPKQLSQTELTIAIGQAISQVGATSIKDMGKVMKALKEHHEGLYDGTEASKQIKEKLNVIV
jgi:uncharacterized protein YqeY